MRIRVKLGHKPIRAGFQARLWPFEVALGGRAVWPLKLACPRQEHQEASVGHGRVETRAARVCADVAGLAHHCWPGLAAIGCVDRTRICKRTGVTTMESQLYLLGHAYTPERLLALSRGHWTVENNLHWVLDVTMGEDASLVRRDHGPRNRATLKRVALNAVRVVTGRNSMRHTMRDAVLDVRVLADILDHMPVT